MKAVAYDEFGDASTLSVRELSDPLVGPDTVLIRVRAASVNPVDWKIRSGYLQGALPHHLPIVPGWDVSGVVEAAGPAVRAYQPGDEVIGYVREDHVQRGTYAELVSAPQRTLAHKPATLDFPRAAGLPLAGLTALQSLRAVRAGAGDTVLVHAGAGGVGHLAVQLARALGATRVIATASEHNHDFLRSLGAEPITYGDGLPERLAELVGGDGRVDAAVDFAGGQALAVTPRIVRHPARHSSVEETAVGEQGGQYVFVQPDHDDLRFLGELADAGKLGVELAQQYPLEQAAEAQRASETARTRGKIVITVP